MTHPKHKRAPKGKQLKDITEKMLPIGRRSAELIRDNRKSAIIVPVVEQPWLKSLTIGEKIRMNISFKSLGYIDVKLTRACFHAKLADIPRCELGHAAEDIDADAQWHDVLIKAAWGGTTPTSTAEMDERAREGWFVLGFKPVWFPKEWWAQAKAARQTKSAQSLGVPSGGTGHDLQV